MSSEEGLCGKTRCRVRNEYVRRCIGTAPVEGRQSEEVSTMVWACTVESGGGPGKERI